MREERHVYFEPSGKLHPSHRYLLDYPPAGYLFTMSDGAWDRFVDRIGRFDILYHNIWRLTYLLPVNLIKSKLERTVRKAPKGSCLTFAINHMVYRNEPWVLMIEWVHMLTGFWMPEFYRHKEEIEAVLGSRWCKRILTWCEPARNSILHNLDCRGFADKIEILPLAVPRREFTKTYRDDRVKLLFVGSAHTPKSRFASSLALAEEYDFHVKGGREVLEIFARLRRDYSNLELVMRARVPREFRRQFEGTSGLTIIEEQLSWKQLEEQFLSADIYVFPCHQVTPWGSILEAMSYELPVVTTDVFANPELIENGKTGFLVRSSEKVPYYDERERFIPSIVTPRRGEFLHALQHTDERLIGDLVEKTKALIEDKLLRRRMGRAARWEVEHGKHALERRNSKLKAIFDEVLK